MTILRIASSHAMAAILLTGGLLAGIGAAAAQDDKAWKVEGKIIGEPRNAGGESKKSEDVSGLACAGGNFPRICIIADDETQGAQVVILRDGEMTAGDFIPLINDAHEGEPLEFDAEGVAYAGDSFYVIGSHGRPRREADARKEARNVARAEAARRVFRIHFAADSVDMGTGRIKTAPEIKSSTRLVELIRSDTDLSPWFDKALADNGLTIEGVAARDGRLFVGMRGPVLPDGNAAVLEVPLTAVFDGQPGNAVLHRLRLGNDTQGKGRGIRDLAAHKNGILVLAGPVNDPPEGYEIRKGDYTVMWWDGTISERLLDLKGYGKEVKPEAITPLDENGGKLRALVLFDGPDEGEPRPVSINMK
jgi:hypothetical protein